MSDDYIHISAMRYGDELLFAYQCAVYHTGGEFMNGYRVYRRDWTSGLLVEITGAVLRILGTRGLAGGLVFCESVDEVAVELSIALFFEPSALVVRLLDN